MNIAGSVALVTGSNRGMGGHFVTQLLERGATKVYATARRPEEVDREGVEVLALDITKPSSVAAAREAASDVTLLINNAGIATGTNLLGDLDQIRLEMETHYYGTLSMVRAFAPVLAAGGGGAVMNVLSALSWFSYDGSNAYAAAKAAEIHLATTLAQELAPLAIRVNAISPGSIFFAGGSWDRYQQADPEGFERFVREEFPSRRLGRVDEVAAVVTFLLSERASWMTGANVVVDGGQGSPSARRFPSSPEGS